MKDIKNIYKKLVDRDKTTKEKTKYIIIFILFFAVSMIFSKDFAPFFNSISTLLLYVAFTIIMVFTSGLAVITLFRSFIVTGAGFSMLALLASEYCDAPVQFHNSDDALRGLLIFGGLYILGVFVKSLNRDLFGYDKAQDEFGKKGAILIIKEANGGKRSVLFLSFYALFLGSLISQLYSVILSIYFGLCVVR